LPHLCGEPASSEAQHLLLCGPGMGQGWVRFETVRPEGAVPSAIAWMIFGERNASGMRRRTWRSARPSAEAISSNDAALLTRTASTQLRERAIACRKVSCVLGSMVPCSAGACAIPFRGRCLGAKGIVSLVGEVASGSTSESGPGLRRVTVIRSAWTTTRSTCWLMSSWSRMSFSV
jgi:hypothetical protein